MRDKTRNVYDIPVSIPVWVIIAVVSACFAVMDAVIRLKNIVKTGIKVSMPKRHSTQEDGLPEFDPALPLTERWGRRILRWKDGFIHWLGFDNMDWLEKIALIIILTALFSAIGFLVLAMLHPPIGRIPRGGPL